MRIETNGVGLEVRVEGPDDGTPVVLLHGWPDRASLWDAQITALNAAGYRTIAPDLRGFGDSDKPVGVESYNILVLAGDVLGVLDHLEIAKAHIVGHDWGSALAWAVAGCAADRVESLVAMSVGHPSLFGAAGLEQRRLSWYMLLFQMPGLPERAMTARGAQSIRRAFHGMAIDKSHFTDDVLDRYAADAQRPGAIRGMVNWYRAAVRHPGKLAGPWPVIETPTLIIWGEEDAALGIELLDGTEEFVRDLTIRRLPKVSHWVQQEAPEQVNAILAEWLAAPRV